MKLKWTCRRLRITWVADFDFSTEVSNSQIYTKVVSEGLCWPELTSSATSGRLQIMLMTPRPPPTSSSQNDFFKIFSAPTRASNSKIPYHVAPDGLYTCTRNDINSSFQSTASLKNVSTVRSLILQQCIGGLFRSLCLSSAALCIVAKRCKIILLCVQKSDRNVGTTFWLVPFSTPLFCSP